MNINLKEMKKMKIVFKNIFAVLILGFLALGCSSDENSANAKKEESTEEFSKPTNLNGLYCYVSGKTVFYDQITNECTTKALPGSTGTFIYNSSFEGSTKNIKWNVISSVPTGSVSVIGSSNDANISLNFASNFESAVINVVGESLKGEICGPNLIITK